MVKKNIYYHEINHVYKPLREYFNTFAVGFPKTKSQIEYKLLRTIYEVEDIPYIMVLIDKDEPIESIQNRYVQKYQKNVSQKELHEQFLKIRGQGGLRMYKNENGVWMYALAPFLVGLYEYSLKRFSKEWIDIIDGYMHEKFAMNYLSTEIPQMRVIPINEAIEDTRGVLSYENVREIIQNSPGPFIVGECVCKLGKLKQEKPCKTTDRLDVCMATGPMAKIFLAEGWGREISKQEALDIQNLNESEGLIMQVENSQEPEFFCSCCKCCCGPLHMGQYIPRSVDFLHNNYKVKFDGSLCIGCKICEKNCVMGAISITSDDNETSHSTKRKKGTEKIQRTKIQDTNKYIKLDLLNCIGCGLCVSKCPKHAIKLVKKDELKIPPINREELYDIIRKNKRGTLGKYYKLLRAILGKKV